MSTSILVNYKENDVVMLPGVEHYFEQDGFLNVTQKYTSNNKEFLDITHINLDKVRHYSIRTEIEKEDVNNG